MPRTTRRGTTSTVAAGEPFADLLAPRSASQYNADEERFSVQLHYYLDRLLRGEQNQIPLVRKYHKHPDRLGVMRTPPDVNRKALRLPVIRRIVNETLAFLYDGSPGTAPSRCRDGQKRIIEVQEFTTKWPHILLVRTDIFDGKSEEHLETIWTASRMQNQQAQIRANRLLSTALLGWEAVKFIVSAAR